MPQSVAFRPLFPLVAFIGLAASLALAAPTRSGKRVEDDRGSESWKADAERMDRMAREARETTEQLFQVDGAAVKKAIEAFGRAKDPKEKIAMAQELAFVRSQLEVLRRLTKSGSPGTSAKKIPRLTLKERATLDRAVTYLREAQARVDRFEDHLSREEILAVTADNPSAVSRATGRLMLFTSTPRCSPRHYESLKRETGLEELAANGPHVMVLASLADEAYVEKYIDRILTLVRTSPKHLKDRDTLVGYYQAAKDVVEPAPDVSERIDAAEKALVSRGIAKNRLRAYVTGLATRSPECLSRMNFDLVRHIRSDVAKERGKYLLSALRAYIAERKKKPEDLPRDLELQPDHPIHGSLRDPWENEYELKYEIGRVSLVSSGADGEKGTEDDVAIGPVALP